MTPIGGSLTEQKYARRKLAPCKRDPGEGVEVFVEKEEPLKKMFSSCSGKKEKRMTSMPMFANIRAQD